MGTGKINVWIREPNDCTVSEMDGYAWARTCCVRDPRIYQVPLKKGHAEIEVPPGCYVVDASWKPGCCGTAKETVIIVGCGDTACANLLREYAGEPIRRIPSLVSHAREAKIPETKIKEMVELFEKIAKTVPEEKIGRFSERELELKREVSDEPHKKILDEFGNILKRR